jgi:voltage-gated potassium channel
VFRQRLFEIIEVAEDGDRPSQLYDIMMVTTIIVSLLPLTVKEYYDVFYYTDTAAMIIFIFDYVARLITADLKFTKYGKGAFIRYPITPMAIIDLLSILPFLTMVDNSLKLLRICRILESLRIIRVFKMLRYSRNLVIVLQVLKNCKGPLIAVCAMAIGYIVVAALVIFNVEADSFDNFFDAIYWATVSLTTVGYGDIYPVTTVGRIVTMISSLLGIAVVALPASIITAGYMKAIDKDIAGDDDPSDKS